MSQQLWLAPERNEVKALVNAFLLHLVQFMYPNIPLNNIASSEIEKETEH